MWLMTTKTKKKTAVRLEFTTISILFNVYEFALYTEIMRWMNVVIFFFSFQLAETPSALYKQKCIT